jgi:hypothetical protein
MPRQALDRTLAIDLALLEGWNPVASSVSPLPIAPLLTLTERELRTVPWDEFLDGVVARLATLRARPKGRSGSRAEGNVPPPR